MCDYLGGGFCFRIDLVDVTLEFCGCINLEVFDCGFGGCTSDTLLCELIVCVLIFDGFSGYFGLVRGVCGWLRYSLLLFDGVIYFGRTGF